MSIKIIDTLTPLGNFPVSKAENIDVSGTALSTVLNSKTDKTYVDTKLAEKANTSYVDSETAKKVDKVSGKGLSSNDFTDYDKSKLSSISGDDLLDVAECWPFAHNIINNRQSQGFCAYEINETKYCACAAAKLSDDDLSELTIYNLETGAKIKTVSNTLFAHMNDITYYDGKIYIANGDSTNTIIVCNLSDYSVSEKTIPEISGEKIYGIEYHDANFYTFTVGGGAKHVNKYNVALTQLIKSGPVSNGVQFNVTQGMFGYGDYVFVIRGRNDRKIMEPYVNSASVYRKSDLEPVKTMYIPYGAELEAISELDGVFYFHYHSTSKAGMILKGTILCGEKIYGTQNLSESIGFGRFEKSDEVFINEDYTGFFVNNTYSRPFNNWPEANTFMVNPNIPRYNVYLLSDFNTEFAVHPSINSYIYFYGAQYSDAGVRSYTLRTINKGFNIRNGTNVGAYYLKFDGEGSCDFEYNDYVRIEQCVINRAGFNVETCSKVIFDSTSINYQVSLNSIPNVSIIGTYTAINNCFTTNRLIDGVRITALPSDKSDGWTPFEGSITGKIYVSSNDLCKKILGYHLYMAGTKTVNNSDVIADFNLQGKYVVGSNNTIADVPNHNAGYIELVKGSNDNRKCFTFVSATSAKVWKRIINSTENYDSGWFEIYNDTHANISLFEKVGVIGDSFASGETYTTGSAVDNYNVSWLQILARQNGFTGTNYSKGGLTSQTWLTDAKGLPLLQSSDAENLYLIALGINDANKMTLGTADDIGSETATTFYGCYSRIINAVKTKNSRARIICLSPARFGGNYDTFKEAIRVIAEEMNVPYVDISTHPYFKTAFYSDNQVSNHPTALNYSAMATAYKELIEKCMIDRQGYFNDYI